MKFTDVRIRKIENQNRLRAVASVTIDDAFVIHEIRIIEGAKDIFVAMPSRKNKFGVFKDVAHPINTETRNEIERVVLDEYNKVLSEEADDVESVLDKEVEETEEVEEIEEEA